MATLFFSYSHADEPLRDQLEKHLSALRRQGVIEAWHDRRIEIGREFDDEISENLEAADVILLLVSSDFLASEYCYEREMRRAIDRHEAKPAIVVPVILRPSDWHDMPFEFNCMARKRLLVFAEAGKIRNRRLTALASQRHTPGTAFGITPDKSRSRQPQRAHFSG